MVIATRGITYPISFSETLFSILDLSTRRLNGDFVSSSVRSPVSTKVTNEGKKTKDHPMDTVDDNKVKLYFSLFHFLDLFLTFKY